MPTENNAFHHPDLLPAYDFIRKGDEREYAKTYASLMIELSPEGTLEKTFATEIMGCTWRLRRCRLIEADFTGQTETDPITQKTVDRARAQSHYLLRRSLSELRILQTERTTRLHLGVQDDIPGLTNTRQLLGTLRLDTKLENAKPKNNEPKTDETMQTLENLMGLADKQLAQQYRDSSKLDFPGLIPNSGPSEDRQPVVRGSFCNPEQPTPPEGGAGGSACPGRDREAERSSPAASFCKPAPGPVAIPKNTPRNAPCPCGSGQKYKRCHGNPVKPAENQAA
jgi:hypothetical protein